MLVDERMVRYLLVVEEEVRVSGDRVAIHARNDGLQVIAHAELSSVNLSRVRRLVWAVLRMPRVQLWRRQRSVI